MKTAMQELIDKVEHAISYNVEGGLVEKYTWEELFNDMYVLLEKEKEQIVEAGNGCVLKAMVFREKLDKMSDDEKRDLLINDCISHGEEYYNETYNQNK